jgi:hypothetical protein
MSIGSKRCRSELAGARDADLRSACLRALTLSREACRAFALKLTRQARAHAFLGNIDKGGGAAGCRRHADGRRRPSGVPDRVFTKPR